MAEKEEHLKDVKRLTLTIKTLSKENKQLKESINNMRDVLRFCARTGVGTYYQQQSAKEM
ncbi:unnamed protein product, partial [marine sediment metagenome]